ncbi:MAG: hypothetical protein KY455_13375 [Euryarchaeota archaeon]|nr:hypothetical protein [Euryarchaeota archaeon]
MSPPAVFPFLLALALLALPLSGCIQGNETDEGDDTPITTPTDRTPPDTTSTWYNQTGIQCNQKPWQEWAEANGYEPRGDAAEEPYVNDEKRADTIRAYYASKKVALDDVQAYRDDLVRIAKCEEPDGWHYWVKTGDSDFDPAEDGWNPTDDEPETLENDQSRLGTSSGSV